jgi:hypothetical protein
MRNSYFLRFWAGFSVDGKPTGLSRYLFEQVYLRDSYCEFYSAWLDCQADSPLSQHPHTHSPSHSSASMYSSSSSSSSSVPVSSSSSTSYAPPSPASPTSSGSTSPSSAWVPSPASTSSTAGSVQRTCRTSSAERTAACQSPEVSEAASEVVQVCDASWLHYARDLPHVNPFSLGHLVNDGGPLHANLMYVEHFVPPSFDYHLRALLPVVRYSTDLSIAAASSSALPLILLVATRDIAAQEELFTDYSFIARSLPAQASSPATNTPTSSSSSSSSSSSELNASCSDAMRFCNSSS